MDKKNQNSVTNIATSLTIVSNANKPLSKNQQTFNNLTKRIAQLEKDIQINNEKLQKLLTFFDKEINPLQANVSEAKIQIAIILDNATEKIKFSKKQNEYIHGAIVGLLDEAFINIEPTIEQKALFDKWSEVSYEEEMEIQENESKSMFADMMSSMYGINLDMSDFDGSPEEIIRLQKEIEEKTANQNIRNKSKKELAREKAVKVETEIKNKNIRSIYIALAKVLHPDTEMDLDQKAEKEEIMKKVTVAYDQKDLTTLLKLEMEWVYNTTEHLEKLTDDKLNIYISALKQQVADLEKEKRLILNNPRYQNIIDLEYLPEKQALNRITKQKKEFKSVLLSFSNLISELKRPNAKKNIVEFAEEYCFMNEEDDFDFFDDNY